MWLTLHTVVSLWSTTFDYLLVQVHRLHESRWPFSLISTSEHNFYSNLIRHQHCMPVLFVFISAWTEQGKSLKDCATGFFSWFSQFNAKSAADYFLKQAVVLVFLAREWDEEQHPTKIPSRNWTREFEPSMFRFFKCFFHLAVFHWAPFILGKIKINIKRLEICLS